MSELTNEEMIKTRLEMQTARIADLENENKRYLELVNKERKVTNVYRSILEFILTNQEFCCACEHKGQKLPECKCTETKDCMAHMFDLWS